MKLFPMHPTDAARGFRPLPWSVVAGWAKQIQTNHGQSVQRLMERGGLSVLELWMAAHNLRDDGNWEVRTVRAEKWFHNLQHERVVELEELAELAWGIIANANGGDWDKANTDWREAAERWRDRYHDGKE